MNQFRRASTDLGADIDVTDAVRLADGGALLLDVREFVEWAAGHAPGAAHMPLANLDPAALPTGRGRPGTIA